MPKTSNRPTMRALAEAKNVEARREMEAAIDEGRLSVRQMTPAERKAADARRAVRAGEREARAKQRSYSVG